MKTLIRLSLLFALLWLFSCSQSAKTTDNNNARVESDNQESQIAYDSAMDLTVTRGEAIEILGKTVGIKMNVSKMQPGASVAWPTPAIVSM